MAADRTDDQADLSTAYQSRSVAEAWQRSTDARVGTLGPLTETMLDLAGVDPGHRVLDVAAGTGEQTIMAARRVGPDGFVLAVDIAPEMLAVAAKETRAAGLANVETLMRDAQALNLEPDSFDAAICRSGLMLMADPSAALAGIHDALRPGGRLSVLVFGSAENNPLQWLPTVIARRAVDLPPPAPREPGMFALSDPAVLEAVFRQAGFHDIEVRRFSTARRFPSAADAVRSLRDTLPSVHVVLRRADEQARKRAWAEIEEELRAFQGPDGLVAPGESLIGVGAKETAGRP